MDNPILLIHDPTIFDKDSAEKSTEKNVLKYYNNDSGDTNFGQIVDDKIFIFNKKENKKGWKEFERPKKIENIKDNTSWEKREENVEKKMIKFKILEPLHESPLFKIPEGQLTLSCNFDFDKKVPFIFTLSNQWDYDYFDTLVIPENLSANEKPLYYRNTTLDELPYKHSGDIHRNGMLLHQVNFNNGTIIDRRHYAGYVVFQGYNRKSLYHLRKTEPNICIVDEKDGGYNVWIYHFPLVKDFVGDANIAFMAKFDCYPQEKRIEWSFLQQPLFSNKLFNVGQVFSSYQKDYETFVAKIENEKRRIIIINNSNDDDDEEDYEQNFKKIKLSSSPPPPPSSLSLEEKNNEEYLYNKNKNNTVIIVQEPLLRGRGGNFVKNIVNDISSLVNNNNCKKYTFHHNIKYYNEEEEEKIVTGDHDNDDDECSTSLPIGGGSVISEHSLIKLAKPMENSKISTEYINDIKYSKKAIMIVSNKYNIANAPKVFSKLNACFIVVNNNNNNDDNIEKKEKEDNDTNISLALVHQGPLSTIFTYFPFKNNNKFYFVRGLCNKKGEEKKTCGDEVTLEDIVIHCGWSSPPQPPSSTTSHTRTEKGGGLSVPAFPQTTNEQYIYDENGREIFCVNTKNSNEGSFILNAVEKYAMKKEEKCRGKDLKMALSWIFAQLEVIINEAVFNKMTKLVLDNLEGKNITLTKKECFQIIKNNLPIEYFLPNKINEEINDDTNFDRNWLKNILNGVLLPTITEDFIMFSHLFLKMKNIIINEHSHNKTMFYETILEILKDCVSTKSSYGNRKRDISKKVKIQQSNVLDVQWLNTKELKTLDDLFSKRCEQEGAQIYKIDLVNFRKTLNNDNDNSSSILSIDERFRETPGDLAAAYLECYIRKSDIITLLFEYKESVMIAIPTLDEIIDIMKRVESVTKHDWTLAVLEGSKDYARIMLRHTVAHLINENNMTATKVEPGSPIVGRMVLRLLFNAMEILKPPNADLSKANENDGLIKKLRGLMGLVFSVMASGLERPLTPIYQIFLHDNKIARFNFSEDSYFIDRIIQFWPWLKLDELPVKTRAVDCINKKINNIIEARISQILSENKNEIKMATLLLKLKKRKVWYFKKIRPLIRIILNRNNNNNNSEMNIDQLDDIFSKYVKPTKMLKRDNDEEEILLLIPSSPSSSFSPLSNDNNNYYYTENDLEELENKMSRYIENYNNHHQLEGKKVREKTNFEGGEEDYTNQLECVSNVLKYYNENFTNTINHDEMKKSKLIQNIQRLEKLITERGDERSLLDDDEVQKVWKLVQSISYDNYIKRSVILKVFIEPIIEKLNKIITDIIIKNNHLELDNNNNNEFESLRQLRARLFYIYFKFSNIFYKFGYLPKVIVALSLCKSIHDFIYIYIGDVSSLSKRKRKIKKGYQPKVNNELVDCKYSFILHNYLYTSNEGHFNNLMINDDDKEEEEELLLKDDKKIKLYHKLGRESALQKMWGWYTKNNDDPNETIALTDRIDEMLTEMIKEGSVYL